MAAKGSIAKKEISEKILSAFPNSFLYNDGKEIRINWTEDGVPLQIKLTLTAAKVAVEGGGDVALPGENKVTTAATETSPKEPTEEEKERLKTLLDKLGL